MPLKLPQELWDIVTRSLHSFDALSASEAFIFKPGKARRYASLWYAIFKSDEYLQVAVKNNINSILIGSDLPKYYFGTNKENENTYMVLISDDSLALLPPTLFLECLQPHTIDHQRQLICFESGIKLSYFSQGHKIRYIPDNLPLFKSKRAVELFGRKQLKTFYCFWNDSKELVRVAQGPCPPREVTQIAIDLALPGHTVQWEVFRPKRVHP
jgi:hypothetical protein